MEGLDVREQSKSNGASEEPIASENAAPSAELTAEVDGASLMEQFLSDPSHDYKTLKYGDVMEGIIMHLDRDELLVDIGSKAEGIVPAKEYSSLSAEEKDKLEVGDNILVFVVQPENPEGHPVVSIDRARQEKSWRKLQEIHEANEVIEAEVTNYNKGGLLVNLDGVRGFVPASQVSEIRGGDESSKQADMARLIGSSLPLKVIEINRHRNRLILSERQAIQERRDVMKERLIGELKEGEVRKGRVSSICDFGAFVDIGGADGLVHLSELSWSRVRHPSELLKIGEEVDVYVLGINAQEKKIALSIKRTQAEPWSRVASSYEVGKLVRGTVTQLANFGAFARIEDGIEGLIHVSELADERIQHPKQVVTEAQELILRIIRIDPQRRRMGLSLRRALDTPDDELVAVFGEDILEERDALVQKIRASLDAEGLTGQMPETREPLEIDSGSGTPAAATSEAGDASDTAATPEQTPAVISQVAAFEERRQRAEEAAGAQRASRQQTQRPSRPANEAQTFEGEGLSAMEIAFAIAGGPDDLLSTIDAEPEAPKKRIRKPKAVSEASVTTQSGANPPADEPVEAGTDAEVPAASAGKAKTGARSEDAVKSEVSAEAAAEPEAEAPAEPDAAPETETLAKTETAAEPGFEAPAEPEAAAEREAESPAELEAAAEPEAESPAEPEAAAELEAEAPAEPEAAAELEAEAPAEPEASAEPEAPAEPEAATEPEAQPEPEAAAEPEAQPEPEAADQEHLEVIAPAGPEAASGADDAPRESERFEASSNTADEPEASVEDAAEPSASASELAAEEENDLVAPAGPEAAAGADASSRTPEAEQTTDDEPTNE